MTMFMMGTVQLMLGNMHDVDIDLDMILAISPTMKVHKYT